MHTFAIVWGRRRPYVTLHSLSRLLMPANRPTTTQVIDLLAYQQGLKEHHSAQYGVSALHTIGQFLTPMECLGWGAKRKEFLQARRRGSKLRSHLALGWNREAEPWYGTLDGIKKSLEDLNRVKMKFSWGGKAVVEASRKEQTSDP